MAMEVVPLRDAFSRLQPEPCVFVLAQEKGAKPVGMAAGWNMKCTINIPLFFQYRFLKRGNTQGCLLK
jgi:hypothetical protein